MCKTILYGLGDIDARQRLQEVMLGRKYCGNLFHVLILKYELQLINAVYIPRCVLWRTCHPVDLNQHRACTVGFYLHIESLGLDGSHQVGVELQSWLTTGDDKMTRRICGNSIGYFFSRSDAEIQPGYRCRNLRPEVNKIFRLPYISYSSSFTYEATLPSLSFTSTR